VAHRECHGEIRSLARDLQLNGVTQGEGLAGESSKNVVPLYRCTMVGREEAISHACYFCGLVSTRTRNAQVLARSHALRTTIDGSVLVDNLVWGFAVDREDFCAAELNHRFL